MGSHLGPNMCVRNKVARPSPTAILGLPGRLQAELDVDPVMVSAVTGEGIDDLLDRIGLRLPTQLVRVSAHVPYDRQDLVALAHRRGQVVKEAHTSTGTDLVADVDVDTVATLRPYLDEDPLAEPPEPWEDDGQP
jgi:GTPase